MVDNPVTAPTQTDQTTTGAPSEPKVDAQAPASTDTNSSTTANPSPTEGDEGSLLNPKDGAADGAPTGNNDAEPADNAVLFGAPAEDGDYELSGLPEGIALDKDALAAVTPLARELNLSNEGLSKLAAVYTESVLPNVATQIKTQMEADLNTQITDIRKSWATDARAAVSGGENAAGEKVEADPVYAGMALKDVQQVSAKALDRFGGDEFRQFLDDNGLGNHPAMLRFAFQAGRLLSEDTSFERGQGAPAVELTREQKYYGVKG